MVDYPTICYSEKQCSALEWDQTKLAQKARKECCPNLRGEITVWVQHRLDGKMGLQFFIGGKPSE